MRTIFFALTFFIFLGGCRTFTSPARVHKLDNGAMWFDYDASRRGALMIPADSKARVLSEPSPDVAISVVSEFVTKASYKDISGEASAKVTESIAELGKRTQTIMFLREALYRLDELQTTTTLDKDEVKSLYTLVLQTALELAKADQMKELQTLPPEVAERILGGDTLALQKTFDQLLTSPIKENENGAKTMEQYADYLVKTMPIFKDDSLYNIRANGGMKLETLTSEMKKVVQQ